MRVRLTRGKVALVDECDYVRVTAHPWQARPDHGTWYAQRSFRLPDGSRRTINMARFILGIDDPWVKVDHINGDGLDNRRCNLRPTLQHQNSANTRRRKRPGTSRYKGVSWHAAAGKWQARISVRGVRLDLGRYASQAAAYRAYCAAAKLNHGEYCALEYL
jgi:hypothetical protein